MLDSKRRRELLAQANRLSASITIHAGEVSPGAVEHVRSAFGKHELLKIRVQADDGDACEATGRRLAEAIPCEWVGRIGRVVVLYHNSATSADPNDDDHI